MLPTEKIKEIVIHSIPKLSENIVDLGAGTFYYTMITAYV